MTDANPCPAPEHLQKLLIGVLSEDAAVVISEHLSQCLNCQAATQTLGATDTLVNLVRLAGLQPVVATPAEVHQVIIAVRDRVAVAALATAHSETLLSGTDDNVDGAAPRSTSIDVELSDLLSSLRPAQSSEELGRLGDFRLLTLLGHGGMGAVFLAEDLRLQRLVALKLVRAEIARRRDGKERFLREARAAANINHENVVTIYQVGEDNGVPFLAQEFLVGETLETRLAQHGRLPVIESLRIGLQIATGLACAHARGLVHRDIKPGNIFLVQSPYSLDAAENVKLLDFGLARAVSDSAQLTQSGLVIGTPAFMSPEQASGESVDHRTDLFSLGSVLYFMLTGERPFRGENMLMVMSSLASHVPPMISLSRPDVPIEVSALVGHLLAKSAKHRPASASQVVSELTTLISSMMSQPLPPRAQPSTPSQIPLKRPGSSWVRYVCGFMVCLVLGMLLISRTNKGVLKSISENPPAATNDNPDVSRASVSTPVNADKSPPDFMAKVDVDQRRVIPQSTSPSITSGLRPPTEFSEPYIILRNGETVGKYAELPVNRPELREEDIIEIRGNGPYALPEILSDRGLHLRAAEGFHPVFIPDDSVLPNHHWIFVMKGTLRLEGCEFRRMKENDRELFGVWGDACEIVNCTLARGASNFQSLVECRCPIVRISDSLLIAGAGHVAFKLRSEVREISVENTIYLFDSYCAFSIDQSEVSRSFRLEHNTFVGIHFLFGGELFQKQIVRHRLQPLQLRVRHNVFANEADVFAPDYDNELTIDDFRSRLTWQGEGNIAPKFAHQSLLEAIAEPGQAGLTSVPQLQVQANQARGSSSASLRFDPQQWRLLSSDGTVHPSIGVDFSRYHRPPALQ